MLCWKPAICFQVSTGGLWHSSLLWFFASFSVSWLGNSRWLTESLRLFFHSIPRCHCLLRTLFIGSHLFPICLKLFHPTLSPNGLTVLVSFMTLNLSYFTINNNITKRQNKNHPPSSHPIAAIMLIFLCSHPILFYIDTYFTQLYWQWQPHSSTLAWKIPWTEEPVRLQSMRSLRVRHDWATSVSLFTFMHWRRKWQPTPVFLPGEAQGQGAWWAAVYGVAQSQTRLKGLSTSTSILHCITISLRQAYHISSCSCLRQSQLFSTEACLYLSLL